MNHFKPMILMNVKNGFDIIQVYTNEKGKQNARSFGEKLAESKINRIFQLFNTL